MMEKVMYLKFILYLPELSEAGDFHLKDLPGSGKRIDVLCRSLAACFDWGPSTLDKTILEIIALVGRTSCLHIRNPDTVLPRGETWWASAIKDALNGKPPPFIAVKNLDLEGVVAELLASGKDCLWVLDEDGSTLTKENLADGDAQNSFIIGGYRGFDSEALKVFDDHSIYRLSLGTTSYLSSHCVAAIISMYEEMIHDVR
jgi:tRNA (pseudouridine54-N1)-methyltransferase